MIGFSVPLAQDDSGDVITTTVEAPRTRNIQDLSAQIKAAGGALIVDANDSRYIVATNNGLRYSVTRLSDGRYRITASSVFPLLIGGAVVLVVALIASR